MIGTEGYITIKDRGYVQLKDVLPGTYKVWNSQQWTSIEIGEPREVETMDVGFKEGLQISCTPQHRFLTTSGWEQSNHLKRRTVYINQEFDNFECILKYEIPVLQYLTRYELGLFYSRLKKAQLTDHSLDFVLPEAEMELTNEFSAILNKICEFDRYTEFSPRGNRKVFSIQDLNVLKAFGSNHRMIYGSKEAIRGYLRGFFDFFSLSQGELTFKGNKAILDELQRLSLLFMIRTKKNYNLKIYPEDVYKLRIFGIKSEKSLRLMEKAGVKKDSTQALKVNQLTRLHTKSCVEVSGMIAVNGVPNK